MLGFCLDDFVCGGFGEVVGDEGDEGGGEERDEEGVMGGVLQEVAFDALGGTCGDADVGEGGLGELVLGEFVDALGDVAGELEEVLHRGVGDLEGEFLGRGVGIGVHLETEGEGAFSGEIGGYIAREGAVDEGVGVFGGGVEVEVVGGTMAALWGLAAVGGDGYDGPFAYAVVGIAGERGVLFAGLDDEVLAVGDGGGYLMLTAVPGLEDVPSAGIVLGLRQTVDVAGGEVFFFLGTGNVGEVGGIVDGDEEFLGDETGLDETEGVEVNEDDVLALDALGVADDSGEASADDFVESSLDDGEIGGKEFYIGIVGGGEADEGPHRTGRYGDGGIMAVDDCLGVVAHVVGPHDGGGGGFAAFLAKRGHGDFFGFVEGGEDEHEVGDERLHLAVSGSGFLAFRWALVAGGGVGYGETVEECGVERGSLAELCKGGLSFSVYHFDNNLLVAVGNAEGIKTKVSEEGVLSGNFIMGGKCVDDGGEGTSHGHPIIDLYFTNWGG